MAVHLSGGCGQPRGADGDTSLSPVEIRATVFAIFFDVTFRGGC